MSFTTANHYVPQWYQKRFLPAGLKEQKFYYLDLTPERVIHPKGGFHYRDEIRRLGPASCFAQEHLYTLFFRDQAADIVEKAFFGAIDSAGAKAVEFFSHYDFRDGATEAFHSMSPYLDTQKLRTPKGLDGLKATFPDREVVMQMRRLWQVHITIWTEGVWEVVCCDNSPTKFLLTDHPVAAYNKQLFPGSVACRYPNDPHIGLLGTHTIFPLDLNHCLIITNLGYVRDPWANPLKKRENMRYFADTIFDLRKIQVDRQIPESQVRAINYILKTRARRYIAAAEKDWLYPECHMPTTMWNKLGDRFFLMPDPSDRPHRGDVVELDIGATMVRKVHHRLNLVGVPAHYQIR